MLEKVASILGLLMIMALIGMYISADSRMRSLEYELNQQRIIYEKELEEMRKKQRITAQDVDFSEKMIKEEL